jgi:signal transduction histidine kinase
LKKSICIFVLAVLLPSVVLGWLALRSAEEQQIILERRTAELYQKETEAVASAARTLVDDERRAFAEAVRQLLAKQSPAQLAREFTARLASQWPRKAIGFALGKDGNLVSPSGNAARNDAELQKFLLKNSEFLCSTIPATVYWVSADDLNRPEAMRKTKGGYDNNAALAQQQQIQAPLAASAKEAPQKDATQGRAQSDSAAAPQSLPPPAPAAAAQLEEKASSTLRQKFAPLKAPLEKSNDNYLKNEAQVRNVMPQRLNEESTRAFSQLVPATADFNALTSDTSEGVVTRYVQDRLDILFWLRPPEAPEMIFGCLMSADALSDLWPSALPVADPSSKRGSAPEFVLALLDDKTKPVATFPASETNREWKRPFVASEIGEALPHWEAALYLQRPQQLQENARSVRRTLTFLIVAALGVIALGGWLVFADARRQLALAQKKTDFVSNVSHELKTPLTSIRMFAELMQNGNAAAGKHPQYLRIIMVEAERLTRLINNVLDFARLERRQKRYDRHPLDLYAVLERTWENHELHLRESGFSTRWQAAPPPYPVVGDEDALAQIVVNLLSNAEKYCGERKEVELHSFVEGNDICVSVLDRGSGVPTGEERKIFEPFYRAHDSLSSGIQGSGLGLTLAQRLAAEHSGEISYQPRAGGGSNFTLRLPLVPVAQGGGSSLS